MTFDPNYYLTQYSNYYYEKNIGGIILYTFNSTKYIIIHTNMIYGVYPCTNMTC